MTAKQTKNSLLRALVVSEKREAAERKTQDALRKRLAAAIASERGIVQGKFYYVLPTPGRKFRAEVVAVDRHWRERERAEHISVLVKYYNRNGAFKTEWITTETNEFTPVAQEAT